MLIVQIFYHRLWSFMWPCYCAYTKLQFSWIGWIFTIHASSWWWIPPGTDKNNPFPGNPILLSLHIISSGSSPPALRRHMIESRAASFVTRAPWDTEFLFQVPLLHIYRPFWVGGRNKRKCRVIATFLGWVGLTQSWQMRCDSKAAPGEKHSVIHTSPKSSKPYHIIFTWQQKSVGGGGGRRAGRWDEEVKRWEWDTKSGDKFGPAVTAEGESRPQGKPNPNGIFYFLCLQTDNRGGVAAFCSKISFASKCVCL